jgi:hypothetical protein
MIRSRMSDSDMRGQLIPHVATLMRATAVSFRQPGEQGFGCSIKVAEIVHDNRPQETGIDPAIFVTQDVAEVVDILPRYFRPRFFQIVRNYVSSRRR